MAKITLVDDDENIVASISLALESHGHKVKGYFDGATGLAALEAGDAVVVGPDHVPVAFERQRDGGDDVFVIVDKGDLRHVQKVAFPNASRKPT